MKAVGGRRKAEASLLPTRSTNERPTRADYTIRAAARIGCSPAAMTLFELLLVLVLLVVVGSLAAPLFEGSFSSIRLRRGTDQVVASWSQARTHAIESGQIYQFRFEPEGNDYRIDAWSGGIEPDLDETELATTSAARANDELTLEERELAEWKLEASLPEEIVFSSAQSVSLDELGQRTATQLGQDNTTQWSAPILFFPDGTTSDASLLLQSGKKLYRRATLRALTGVARTSDLLSREEVDRFQSR